MNPNKYLFYISFNGKSLKCSCKNNLLQPEGSQLVNNVFVNVGNAVETNVIRVNVDVAVETVSVETVSAWMLVTTELKGTGGFS